MIPTLRTSRTAQRTTPRRGPLALVVLAAATLTCLASTSHVEAGSQAQRRSCATANAATYTVAEGDSWFGIAVASGTSTSALLGANGADASDVLYPGDVLCLPPGVASPGPRGGCAATHVVERGDSWFAISRAAGVSMNGLLESNNATATTVIQPGAKVCLPAGARSRPPPRPPPGPASENAPLRPVRAGT